MSDVSLYILATTGSEKQTNVQQSDARGANDYDGVQKQTNGYQNIDCRQHNMVFALPHLHFFSTHLIKTPKMNKIVLLLLTLFLLFMAPTNLAGAGGNS